MRPKILSFLPLLLALFALYAAVAWSITQFFTLRPGAVFTYALDDAYIHMALAKNLVQHGVYGVTPHAFTSSSSSILWTTLLAAVYAVFGVSETAPFWLNIFFASLALLFASIILRRVAPNQPFFILIGLLAFIFLTPLYPQVLTGMETAMQIALTLAFAALAAHVLAGANDRPSIIALLFVGLLFSAARYEDLALIAFVCLLLLIKRRWQLSFALGAVALLPVIIYGIVSVQHGWLFLPNSVLVKAVNTSQGWREPFKVLSERFNLLLTTPFLRVIFLSSVLVLLFEAVLPSIPTFTRWLLLFFPVAYLAQVLFGQLGWFYRYEAYVLALGIIVLLTTYISWFNQFQWSKLRAAPLNRRSALSWLRPALALIFTLYLFSSLSNRAILALQESPGALTNIYDQQVQMARFLKTYYAGNCVALNDIGAASYMGDVCIIDLAGLATQETARAYLNHLPLRPAIESLVEQENLRIAIVYTYWFGPNLPSSWVRVGEWQLDQRVVAGGDTVTFYATTPAEAALLRQHLLDFAPHLPAQVTWQVYK